jgi:anti-sigma factor RsiW
MKCRHVKKIISQYVDDELKPGEKKNFDSHIQDCASCREELEETRALHQMFDSARRFPAPHGFATRVLANLEEKKGLRPLNLLPIKPIFLRTVKVTFALVVMTIGIISGNLLLVQRTEPIGQRAVRGTFSLDLFQATPPDSIGGIYYTLMSASHEK